MTDQHSSHLKIGSRQLRRTESLWECRKGQHTFVCDLLDHGPDGVDVQLLRDGQCMCGRWFQEWDTAMRFAASLRLTIERGRWIPE